jgi:hypothetical protein
MSESPALQAARQGRAALEAFQRANPGSTLDFRGVDFRDPQNECIDFSGFEFLLDVDFGEAEFGDTPTPWQVHGYRPPGGPGPVRGAALFHEAMELALTVRPSSRGQTSCRRGSPGMRRSRLLSFKQSRLENRSSGRMPSSTISWWSTNARSRKRSSENTRALIVHFLARSLPVQPVWP